MDGVWMLTGWVRLRLTSADPAARLREFSEGYRLERIVLSDDLTAEFDISAPDAKKLCTRGGERLEVTGGGGLPRVLAGLGRWKILTAAVLLLGVLTVLLPTRIWFVEVRGNEGVPAALIAERAEECGVYFGASRRELRSEQVKNHLLWAIPELKWAGVNTEGCTAVITVAVRREEEGPADGQPGDIVAALDGVVSEVVNRAGTVLVRPGQAVRAGETLIGGTGDLGNAVLSERAAGEVYGLTRRELMAVLPSQTRSREESGEVVRKFSLRIGKKYVNFSNDSGILYGTCVKMRTVKYLRLPGGFQLPVALVTDTYRLCRTEAVSREMDTQALLTELRRYARDTMTAGTILREEASVQVNSLRAVLHCRELIGVFRPGIETEGDTNERENRERGAG